jgi:hypothetical protein
MRKLAFLIMVLIGSYLRSDAQEIHPATNYPDYIQSNSVTESGKKFYLTGSIDNNKKAFYISSIEKADMESYRLRDKEVIVEFKEGFKCVLPSAKQLIITGSQIDPNSYKEGFDNRFVMPVFSIQTDGHLVAEYEKVFK